MTRPVLLAAAALAALGLAGVAQAQQGNPGAHFVENWDLDGSGDVSLAEATERRGDIFTTFDANDDGFLDGAEYDAFDEARAADMEGQEGHGKGGGMRQVQEGMMRQATDANGDGRVSRQEFLDAVPAWFQRMDRNGDGKVTTDDFGRGRGRG